MYDMYVSDLKTKNSGLSECYLKARKPRFLLARGFLL
jgi:hypothetical protein